MNTTIRQGNFYEIMNEIRINEISTTDREKTLLYGAEKGIDRVVATLDRVHEFVREDAKLVVIFVSDEDNACLQTDYDNAKCKQYFQNSKTADDLLDTIKNSYGYDKHFTVHSIVDTGYPDCPRDEKYGAKLQCWKTIYGSIKTNRWYH